MNDKLIKLAYEFRDAELWEALADNDIFAVQLHDGKMGYCSVMGNSNCHYSLGLYIGETGWNSYLNNIRIAGQEDPEEGSQAMSEMDCINCDFTPMNEAQKGAAWEKVVHFGWRTALTQRNIRVYRNFSGSAHTCIPA